jgi:hypothetical protein
LIYSPTPFKCRFGLQDGLESPVAKQCVREISQRFLRYNQNYLERELSKGVSRLRFETLIYVREILRT